MEITMSAKTATNGSRCIWGFHVSAGRLRLADAIVEKKNHRRQQKRQYNTDKNGSFLCFQLNQTWNIMRLAEPNGTITFDKIRGKSCKSRLTCGRTLMLKTLEFSNRLRSSSETGRIIPTCALVKLRIRRCAFTNHVYTHTYINKYVRLPKILARRKHAIAYTRFSENVIVHAAVIYRSVAAPKIWVAESLGELIYFQLARN